MARGLPEEFPISDLGSNESDLETSFLSSSSSLLFFFFFFFFFFLIKAPFFSADERR